MLIPTKHENLQQNILVVGAVIITFLKKKSYNIEALFQKIKNGKNVSLDQYYNTLVFLWLSDIIELEEFYIEFKNGINYIFGKKDIDNPSESLNGIGKSLLLDLIDFCLISSFRKIDTPRLFEAKEFLSDFKIVLEFRVNNIDYIIKRSVDSPNKIEFGQKGKVLLY